MSLLTLANAQLAFGDVALLDHADFSLLPQERVGLIGRNGTGKSSLLKILAGLEKPDDGTLQVRTGLRLAYVAQEAVFAPELTVQAAVSHGLLEVQELIERYVSGQGSADDLDALQNQIEAQDGWNWQQRIEETLQRLQLDGSALVATLSGGNKKRVALAQTLVTAPDVLLLDEPTNHLDLQSIAWLEQLLLDFKGALVCISHDRAFLDAVCTRMVELDRGNLQSFSGNFAAYQSQKAAQAAYEATVNAKADKLLAQEEVWVRKGVEARRTRSQSRISRLQDLRQNRADRRNALGRVRLDVASGVPSSKIIANLEDVSLSLGGKQLIEKLTFTVLRGDKVGLLGNNGVGKTTLLRLILGQLEPDSGKIKRGQNQEVAYFDQMREQLDLEQSLEDFISPGSEWVEINGSRKHIKSYLGDFLFSPARSGSPIKSLSGGERNRLLLARLFARPANVLVLDEPTNDLDIDTLELLEELLQTYPGTVFLVSHDRAFMDAVATSIIAHEAGGTWVEYEGSVADYMLQSARRAAQQTQAKTAAQASPPKPETPAAPSAVNTALVAGAVSKPKKLSYKEQRELDQIPEQIEQLEAEQHSLQSALHDATLYATNPTKAAEAVARLDKIDEILMHLLERWELLSVQS